MIGLLFRPLRAEIVRVWSISVAGSIRSLGVEDRLRAAFVPQQATGLPRRIMKLLLQLCYSDNLFSAVARLFRLMVGIDIAGGGTSRRQQPACGENPSDDARGLQELYSNKKNPCDPEKQ